VIGGRTPSAIGEAPKRPSNASSFSASTIISCSGAAVPNSPASWNDDPTLLQTAQSAAASARPGSGLTTLRDHRHRRCDPDIARHIQKPPAAVCRNRVVVAPPELRRHPSPYQLLELRAEPLLERVQSLLDVKTCPVPYFVSSGATPPITVRALQIDRQSSLPERMSDRDELQDADVAITSRVPHRREEDQDHALLKEPIAVARSFANRRCGSRTGRMKMHSTSRRCNPSDRRSCRSSSSVIPTTGCASRTTSHVRSASPVLDLPVTGRENAIPFCRSRLPS